MAIAYTPPGVSVDEFTSPSAAPLLAVAASVCLIGLSAGLINRTDAIVLTGTTPTVLPGVPAGSTMTSGSISLVIDAITPSLAPSGYTVTTDYTFSPSTHAVTRVGGGAIPSGSTVYVTYSYVPADYFSPIRLDNMSDVQDRFGSAWDITGTVISSPLSQGAMLAFENGATSVVLQPLFFDNSGTKQQPNATQAAAAATWADNFEVLRDIEDINLIVPIVGQSQANVTDAALLGIAQALQDHIKFMADQDQYIIGIVGEDSSTSSLVGQDVTIRSHAVTLAARYGGQVTQQMVLINTSKFLRPQPSSFGGTLYVGAQYVAAAISGMIAARRVSQSLTRKIVSGITGVADPRTKAEKNVDASTGLMVIEQRGVLCMVRHSITLDTTGTAKRELSVVRAKHRMIESVRDTLDTQIIGEVIADGNAAGTVADAVRAVLELLKTSGDLVAYSDVQARTVSLEPSTVEVRFSYKPSFPVNYVNIIFSLDLTNQEVTLPSTLAINV